jgi:hypothetical protein
MLVRVSFDHGCSPESPAHTGLRTPPCIAGRGAGLLQATLAERLGIEKLTGQLMDLGERPARRVPGCKLLSLVHAVVASDELSLSLAERGNRVLPDTLNGDLSKPRWQNHERLGRDFRSYYGFLDRVRGMEERGSMYEFYRVLPGTGRELFASGLMEAKDLYRLFRTFANEFMETFGHG